VLSRGSGITNILRPGAAGRSRTGRLLTALGLAAIGPEVAAAARRSDRRSDDHVRNDDAAQGNEDDGSKQTQDEQGSDRKSDSKASAEDHGTGDKSGDSGKSDRNQQRSADDQSGGQNGSDSDKGRDGSGRRDAHSDSTSTDRNSTDDHSHHHSVRQVQDFRQKANNSTADSTPSDSKATDSTSDHTPDVTTATPANPNVSMDHVPSTSVNDLLVQGNDHVIASVSTNGGFAFARSGDVVAVTGPDGASIIQSDEVNAGTNGTNPAEPSPDGGNNETSFAS
jgi:hypothetical protein